MEAGAVAAIAVASAVIGVAAATAGFIAWRRVAATSDGQKGCHSSKCLRVGSRLAELQRARMNAQAAAGRPEPHIPASVAAQNRTPLRSVGLDARLELEQPSNEDVLDAMQFVLPSVKSIKSSTFRSNSIRSDGDDDLATLPGDADSAIGYLTKRQEDGVQCDCCCCRGECADTATINGEDSYGKIKDMVNDTNSTIGSRRTKSTFSFVIEALLGGKGTAVDRETEVMIEFEAQQLELKAAAKKLGAVEEMPSVSARRISVGSDATIDFDAMSVNSGVTVGSESDGDNASVDRFLGDTIVDDNQRAVIKSAAPVRPTLPLHFIRHVRQGSDSSSRTSSSATTISSGESLSRYLSHRVPPV